MSKVKSKPQTWRDKILEPEYVRPYWVAEILSAEEDIIKMGQDIKAKDTLMFRERLSLLIDFFCDFYKVERICFEDNINNREPSYLRPRQLIMYNFEIMFPRLGTKKVGETVGRDHATVIHTRYQVNNWIESDNYFRMELLDCQRFIVHRYLNEKKDQQLKNNNIGEGLKERISSMKRTKNLRKIWKIADEVISLIELSLITETLTEDKSNEALH